MSGADQETIVKRWQAIVEARIDDRTTRSDLVGIALVFAELAGRRQVWESTLGGWHMTESAIVNGWIQQGETRGVLRTKRRDIVETLEIRFPGETPGEIQQLIEQQESLGLLEDWFRAALRAGTFDQFLAVLRR